VGRLDGKIGIVTGGAMGIGKAAAVSLAKEGAKVYIGDIDDAGGQQTVAEVTQAGGEITYQRTDVGSAADVERLVQAALDRYGKLDVMVNNVGVAIGGTAADMSEDDWQRVININLSGVWRGMKYAIPPMIRNGGGSIINVSSVQSLVGFKGWAGYAASKGGINSLTQQAALEYGPKNIRINAIAPGTIMTPMNVKLYEEADDPEGLMNGWNAMHPIGRLGQPAEVGALIAFLASDDASFITGEIIRIDGGVVIKGE
jgi:NAD(P)-dependent dehydrogenase (short-subunit alcohol dehydrogenase family)